MALPRPILSMTIAPVHSADRERLHAALAMICAADSSVSFAADPSSNITELRGESVEQLSALDGRIEDEFKIPLDFATVDVIRIETIRHAAEGEGKYIRQTGGSGNYGHVKLRVVPNTPGWGIQFASSLGDGVLPAEYLPPIEEGIREAAQGGILAGHEMTDIRVTLSDGSFHEVDSNPMAFRIAASLAFKEAARKAKPVVMEPVMTVTFTVAESKLPATMADISVRRGRVVSTNHVRGLAIVGASIPLAEMLRDAPALPAAMAFESFEPVSSNLDDADTASSAVRNPWNPRPRTGSAAAEPERDIGSDWT